MLRNMIIGSGFHFATNVQEDGTKTVDLRELTAEEHPHPLAAAQDSPECCKAVADYLVGEGEDGSAVLKAHAPMTAGQKLYLAPGNFGRPEPEPEPTPNP